MATVDDRIEVWHQSELVEHGLVPPGGTSILDEHYDKPARKPARAVPPRSKAEQAFLALGEEKHIGHEHVSRVATTIARARPAMTNKMPPAVEKARVRARRPRGGRGQRMRLPQQEGSADLDEALSLTSMDARHPGFHSSG